MERNACRVTPLKSVDQPVPARTDFSVFSQRRHMKHWSYFSGGGENPVSLSLNPIIL
jgi:hypothetical protein